MRRLTSIGEAIATAAIDRREVNGMDRTTSTKLCAYWIGESPQPKTMSSVAVSLSALTLSAARQTSGLNQ
jgi:hypothetical protein